MVLRVAVALPTHQSLVDQTQTVLMTLVSAKVGMRNLRQVLLLPQMDVASIPAMDREQHVLQDSVSAKAVFLKLHLVMLPLSDAVPMLVPVLEPNV